VKELPLRAPLLESFLHWLSFSEAGQEGETR
jgi:hypothetical protein